MSRQSRQTRDAVPFSARLVLARRLVARGPAGLPLHTLDQMRAAGREMRQVHDRLGKVLPVVDPGRNWRYRMAADPSGDVRAYLLAALMGCSACVHLRRGGPQPAYARLPLGRVDCGRCALTFVRPPAEDSDRCDVCKAHDVTVFHPFACQQGPVLLAGDACPSCATVLGIKIEEAAS